MLLLMISTAWWDAHQKLHRTYASRVATKARTYSCRFASVSSTSLPPGTSSSVCTSAPAPPAPASTCAFAYGSAWY